MNGETTEVTIVKEFTFDAAHYLPEYDGPCKRMHGHTYRLQVGFTGTADPFTGMVLDFAKAKRIINIMVIDVLDHTCLNTVETNGFPARNPTAENMVVWIKNLFTETLPIISFVRLYETPTSYAEWRK